MLISMELGTIGYVEIKICFMENMYFQSLSSYDRLQSKWTEST